MGPNACWKLFLDATADGEQEDAIEHLGNLVKWLTGGGFPPNSIKVETVYFLYSWLKAATNSVLSADELS